MSDTTNDELYARAAEMISYFESTLPAELIQQDLDNDDLESLYTHVAHAEAVAAQTEMTGWQAA